MQFLASLEELQDRVGEDDLDMNNPSDVALAKTMLRMASSEARSSGSMSWSPAFCPENVVAIVIEAAARGYMNPGGYATERSDMVNLTRGDEFTTSAHLTKAERRDCRAEAVGASGGYYTVQIVRPVLISNDNKATGVGA